MRSLLLLFLALLAIPASVAAQYSRFTVSPLAVLPADSLLKTRMLTSLDGFLRDKDHPEQPSLYTDSAYLKHYTMGFDEIVRIENSKKYSDSNFFRPQLLNVIRLKQSGEYLIKLGFMGMNNGQPIIRKIYSMVGKDRQDRIVFYPAIDWVVRNWNRQQVGNIHYVYPHMLDMDAARRFDRFNTELAGWFGVKPVELLYYDCSNAQELLRIKGVDYDASANYLRRGDSDEDNNIFMSGVGSPWYAHDLVHFYCAKFLPRPVNRAAEEGLAYYADGAWGESFETCLVMLKKYVADHPGEDLYQTFKKAVTVGDISLKYTINALLLKDKIRRQGIRQALEVLKTENTDEGLDKSLQTHFGLTSGNFNEKIRKLLAAS